jgi:hypothetical protein
MDVFLLIGQSNMSGRGQLDQVEPVDDARIDMFRDGRWERAREPLHTDRGTAGIGLGMSFAAELLRQGVSERVGLVPCAVGATSLSQWEPGAELFGRAVAVSRDALVASEGSMLRGVLWHQGENDSADEQRAATYGERLSGMVAALRRELGAPDVPFVAGELGRYLQRNKARQHFAVINHQLAGLSQTIPKFACVSSEGLCDDGFLTHFDARSLRDFGVRFAQAYVSVL